MFLLSILNDNTPSLIQVVHSAVRCVCTLVAKAGGSVSMLQNMVLYFLRFLEEHRHDFRKVLQASMSFSCGLTFGAVAT